MTYFSVAVPGATLGLLWPLIRLSWHLPLGLLGVLLTGGVLASVLASLLTGRLLSRIGPGPVLAAGCAAAAVALAGEAAAPSVWVFAVGMVVFGLGTGAIDAALNAYAATRFGPRRINWMHATYGLGATAGPLLATGLLAAGLGWRGTYAVQAALPAAVAVLLALTTRAWDQPAAVAPGPAVAPLPVAGNSENVATTTSIAVAVAFAAVECGIESGAGLWGYVYLTAGRGLSSAAAAVTVSAYWATMFAGRAVLGPVAERFGDRRVLTGGVAGLVAGAILLTVPGPAAVPVTGLVVAGLAAAPIFPLLMLTTAGQLAGADATWAVSLQVAASAGGNAALPAGLGLVIGTLTAGALGPALLLLSLLLAGLYRWLER